MIPLIFFPKLIKRHPWVAVALGIIMFAVSKALIDMWRARRAAKRDIKG